MKLLVLVITMAISLGCSSQVKTQTHEDSFGETQSQLLKAHKAILNKAGRMSKDFGEDFMVLGRYGWYGDGSGYSGVYAFYEPAFEQAKRGWFITTARVIEGSNEVWVGDDDIKFDNSVIGYKLPTMNMSWYEGGEYKSKWFSAKIVGIKDSGKTLIIDQRAPHHAEQWHISIVPNDWQELCNCTNNFSPKFEDGHPVVAELPK